MKCLNSFISVIHYMNSGKGGGGNMSLIIHTIVSLFAVMNPIGNVPIFLSLTESNSVEEKRAIARKSVLATVTILITFMLVGNLIFHLFDITIEAFRITGGILIFGIAYNLIHGKQSKIHSLHENEHEESKAKDDVSITPLAIPIFAGPGTIATVMALAAGEHHWENTLFVFLGLLVIALVTFVIMFYSSYIQDYLGQTGMNVITRIMGLLLAVIAVQMMINGLLSLIKPYIN